MNPLQIQSKLLSYRIREIALCCSLIFLCVFKLNAQEVVNTSRFLSGVFDQITGNTQATIPVSHSDESSNHSFKSAYIKDAEFRTETKDFDLGDQSYRIRVSPSTKAIRSAEEQLYEAYTQEPRDEGQTIFYSRLESAYEFWIDQFVVNSQSTLYEDWKAVLEDKKKVTEKLLLVDNFDLSDYFEVDNEIKELHIKTMSAGQRSELYQNPFTASEVSYEFDDMISIDDIKSFVTSFNPASIENTLKEEEYLYDQIMLEKELDLEIAESRQILKFAEISYSGPHNDPFREKVSFGVGLRLPWDGDSRLKIHELQYKLDNINFDKTIQIRELFVAASEEKYKLLHQIRVHEELVKLREEQAAKSEEFIQTIALTEGFNPLHALEIKEQSIKAKLELIDSLEDIYRSYISFLKRSELLYHSPYRNYLI